MSAENSQASFRAAVQEAGQDHILADWDRLSADQKAHLTSDIQVCRGSSLNFT